MSQRLRRVIGLLVLILGLGACSSNPQHITSEKKSPAQINAELGLAYMRQGNFEVAQEKLQRALLQDPKLASAHHYIAILYRSQGMPEKAEEHYLKALKYSDNDSALQNNYGVFLCEQGRYKEAEKRFLGLLKNPNYKRHDEAYENVGLCAMRIPDRVLAEKHFRNALKINPNLPQSLYQMAGISVENGNYLQGRAFYQRYLAVAQQSPESLWLGIRIERELGDHDLVVRYSSQLKENFPDSEQTQWLMRSEQK